MTGTVGEPRTDDRVGNESAASESHDDDADEFRDDAGEFRDDDAGEFRGADEPARVRGILRAFDGADGATGYERGDEPGERPSPEFGGSNTVTSRWPGATIKTGANFAAANRRSAATGRAQDGFVAPDPTPIDASRVNRMSI